MTEEKEITGETEHDVCHNPCEECRGEGYLENGEVCSVCAGTGCKDQKICVPVGGLGCDVE